MGSHPQSWTSTESEIIGITTIRAFGRERSFRSNLCILMDDTLSLWYASCTLDVWLSIRTQLLAALCLLTTAWVAVYAHVSPGLAGIAITSSLSIVQSLDLLCAAYGKVSPSLDLVHHSLMCRSSS